MSPGSCPRKQSPPSRQSPLEAGRDTARGQNHLEESWSWGLYCKALHPEEETHRESPSLWETQLSSRRAPPGILGVGDKRPSCTGCPRRWCQLAGKSTTGLLRRHPGACSAELYGPLPEKPRAVHMRPGFRNVQFPQTGLFQGASLLHINCHTRRSFILFLIPPFQEHNP